MRRACGATSAPQFVVAGGLGHINGVLDAVDHVEIIAGEGGTQQRLLVARRRIDPAEYRRRSLEPFPERGAVDLHHPHAVGIRVDVGHILDRDRTLGDVGVEVRSAAPTAFERRRGRENRQRGEVGSRRNQRRGVSALGLVDKLNRRIVGDHREIGVQRRREPADRRAHIVKRRRMRGSGGVEHRRVRFDERDRGAAGVAPGDRPGLNLRLLNPPAAGVELKPEIDDAEMAAPEIRP